jgi:hypothetical protein
MAAKAGIDLLRGRPTVAIASTEAKLQQRKLDALKRGIHRIKDAQSLPYGIHLIGLGRAGANVIEEVLRVAPPELLDTEGSRLTALAVDIGDADLRGVAGLAAKFSTDRSHIETAALPVPSAEKLLATLRRYPDFLKLEYPMYHWPPDYQPWLPPDSLLEHEGAHVPRAVAKALYGSAYYDGQRPLAAALRRFAQSVEATRGDSVVCIVFGLGGGSGSGIAVDLARHLSNSLFGRRVLVAGIGIAPCDGDVPEHAAGHLFPLLNELDCMGDDGLNQGVVQACGDLYKNPFTAGFILVPQQHVWASSHNLSLTHARVDREIASLLTLRKGANLWEMLRLLNWVAAPSTQHSAARTPWGPKWIHMLGFADLPGGKVDAGGKFPDQLGLRPGYRPEFIEMRVAHPSDTGAAALATNLEQAFAPDIAPQIVDGGAEGSAQFILPRISKRDLALFYTARDAYDQAPQEQRLLDHSFLLERGVLLSEPSTRLQGMAGASLWGGSWIAVPLAELRGDQETSDTA